MWKPADHRGRKQIGEDVVARDLRGSPTPFSLTENGADPKLFTKGQFGSADISWDDIYTQTMRGEAIPDLAMLAAAVGILIEIKTTPWRELTDKQPGSYLAWLAKHQAVESRFFVAVVPPFTIIWMSSNPASNPFITRTR
jgi:hypothetical protein